MNLLVVNSKLQLSSETSSVPLSVISNAPFKIFCIFKGTFRCTLRCALDCTVKQTINCNVKPIFFFIIFLKFLVNLKLKSQVHLQVQHRVSPRVHLLLNRLMNFFALTRAPPCASSTATQL